MLTCEQCQNEEETLFSVSITCTPYRRIGNMWVCPVCWGRLVVDGEPPAVGVRIPKPFQYSRCKGKRSFPGPRLMG